MSAPRPSRKVGEVNVYRCHCLRCGHDWTSVGAAPPTSCAGCKSKSWNVPAGTVKLGRKPSKGSK